MAGDESRGGTTNTTYHDWLRAWQCVQAIRPTATILRVFRLVPGHQQWVVELLLHTPTLPRGSG